MLRTGDDKTACFEASAGANAQIKLHIPFEKSVGGDQPAVQAFNDASQAFEEVNPAS
jgi:hypothetical protein